MSPETNDRVLLLILLLTGSACESPQKPTALPPSAPSPPPVVKMAPSAPVIAPLPSVLPAPPAPPPIGVEDPFARPDPTVLRTLDAGWRGLRKKDYGEARAAFHAVVNARPDHTVARWQELRAAALDGDFGAVPSMWRELLARDFVGHARRLDTSKEMKPLRASAAWAELQAITREMQATYAAGLGRGLFFVARTRGHLGAKLEGDETKLELDQEAYHFDPTSRRIRRLSDTGGHVLAIHHDGERRQLIMLTAGTMKKTLAGEAFGKPEAVALSLDTLERTGPFAIDVDAASVDLCFSGKGEPIWSVLAAGATEPVTWTLDATRSTLVRAGEPCEPALAATVVSPSGVVHHRADPEGVALSDDGMQLTGVDADRPVRASRAIRPGSFGWSPGKKRFAYTGRLDRCDEKPDPNALYVWDAERKRSTRLTSAVSAYESEWLDDDRLAYEAGLGTRLKVHDFAADDTLTLDTPAGAGLFGLPTLACDRGQIQALAR
jgi:hypothetical protein